MAHTTGNSNGGSTQLRNKLFHKIRVLYLVSLGLMIRSSFGSTSSGLRALNNA